MQKPKRRTAPAPKPRQARHVGQDAPVPPAPTEPHGSCGSTEWWWRVTRYGRAWICARCHPEGTGLEAGTDSPDVVTVTPAARGRLL